MTRISQPFLVLFKNAPSALRVLCHLKQFHLLLRFHLMNRYGPGQSTTEKLCWRFDRVVPELRDEPPWHSCLLRQDAGDEHVLEVKVRTIPC